MCGPGSSVGIATELPGWTVRDRKKIIPVGTRFSARPEFFIQYFIFHCKRNGIPLSNTFLYLKQNIIHWPDDDLHGRNM